MYAYAWNTIFPSPYGPWKRNKAFGGECSLQPNPKTLSFERFWRQIIFLSHSAKVKCLRIFLSLLLPLLAIHYDSQNPNCSPILGGFSWFNLHHSGKFGVHWIWKINDDLCWYLYPNLSSSSFCTISKRLSTRTPSPRVIVAPRVAQTFSRCAPRLALPQLWCFHLTEATEKWSAK